MIKLAKTTTIISEIADCKLSTKFWGDLSTKYSLANYKLPSVYSEMDMDI